MYDVFSIPDFQFPEGFLWGVAAAGHQIEGNNINSNHYQQEMEWPVDPKGIKVPSGMACNHYNMVDEDTALIKKLGYPSYRMSVEWSRIEPEEGRFCEEAIQHYLREIAGLKENGIQIMMTMHHFTHPTWFDREGGFQNLDNRRYFERYLEKVVPLFATYVDSWNVFNEFNMGESEQELKEKAAVFKYHALGYHIIKKYSKAPVSSAHALIMYDAKRRFDLFDTAMQQYDDMVVNEFFLHGIRTGEVVLPPIEGYYDPDIKGSCDFWSVNIYTRTLVDARAENCCSERYAHKHLRLIDMPFYLDELHPEVVIHQLNRLKDKPVIITENGLACKDDDWRIVFITLYLSALHEAMRMGVDLQGYLYWSLLDNYEWWTFRPRFGLVDVDFETFQRTPKPSAYFYRDIIRNNGFSQEILRKYLHQLPTIS